MFIFYLLVYNDINQKVVMVYVITKAKPSGRETPVVSFLLYFKRTSICGKSGIVQEHTVKLLAVSVASIFCKGIIPDFQILFMVKDGKFTA